jgi:hypothetical protein
MTACTKKQQKRSGQNFFHALKLIENSAVKTNIPASLQDSRDIFKQSEQLVIVQFSC